MFSDQILQETKLPGTELYECISLKASFPLKSYITHYFDHSDTAVTNGKQSFLENLPFLA